MPRIASFFDDAEKVAEDCEYNTCTGTVNNVRVSVTSAGIGGPFTAIPVGELSAVGAYTSIRVARALKELRQWIKSPSF